MFNQYPYTDGYELNTDWIISKIKNVETSEANAKQYAEDADHSRELAEGILHDTERVEGLAEDAQHAAERAQTAAEDAQRLAENARDAAQGYAGDAEDVVHDTLEQINLLQSRVDNIIPDGTQTAGNTELLDIRVGEDGKIYDSAGNAVRGQVHDLKIGNVTRPDFKGTQAFNPHPGAEGTAMPGYGRCYFDVVAFQGKDVTLNGTGIGYSMQFSGDPTGYDYFQESDYIGGTKTATGSPERKITISATAKYLAVNIASDGDVDDIYMYTQDSFVTKAELATKQDALTFDNVPTQSSSNPVKSGGVYDSVKAVDDRISRANNSIPDFKGTQAFNPHPGAEGTAMPGYGRCYFDVVAFQGKDVTLNGTGIGYSMQFSGDPTGYDYFQESDYIGGTKTATGSPERKITISATAKYLAVNIASDGDVDDIYMITPDTFATHEYVEDYIDARFPAETRRFVAIGDSITQGSGASDYSYSYYWRVRSALVAADVIDASSNFGIGGANTASIGANVNAVGLMLSSDVTIPAGTTPVTVTLNIGIKDPADNLIGVNPCFISGIEGSLSYSAGDYTFTRSEAGSDSKYVCAGTQIITDAGIKTSDAEIMVIFAGTNDHLDIYPANIDAVCSKIEAITKKSKNGKYLIINPYVESTADDFRNQLRDTYGSRYIDMYAYMSGQSVYDAIAEGLIVSGSQSDWLTLLTRDGTHPNDEGHQLIAEQILMRMQDLGWY